LTVVGHYQAAQEKLKKDHGIAGQGFAVSPV
jgi:hypothetical protein